jgi:hypothetical protein
LCGNLLLYASLLFLTLKSLSLLQGNNIHPTHIVLDVADGGKLRQEAFPTHGGGASAPRSKSFVIFGVIQDIVEIHVIELLVLLIVVFVETRRERGRSWGLSFSETNKCTYIFWAPYFRTAWSSSLLRSLGFALSFRDVLPLELRCACEVSIWLMTG